MGASRTRQTRANVSYKVDSSDDEDLCFAGHLSERADALDDRSKDRVDTTGVLKGRKNLALKKSRTQERANPKERAEARELERALKESLHNAVLPPELPRNGGICNAPNLSRVDRVEVSDSEDEKLPSHDAGGAFQRLLDVAFDVSNSKPKAEDIQDSFCLVPIDNTGTIKEMEEGRQAHTLASDVENAFQPSELEGSISGGAQRREVEGFPDRPSDTRHEEGESLDMKEGNKCKKNVRTPLKKTTVKASFGSPAKDAEDDEDWFQEDVVNGDSSDDESDFCSEESSGSEADTKRGRQARASTISATKKRSRSTVLAPVTKGPRTKSTGSERRSTSIGHQGAISRKTPNPPTLNSKENQCVEALRKTVVSKVSSRGLGARTNIPNLQPAKLRMKMANKEAAQDNLSARSPGDAPLQLVAPNVLHRRVLGLSRRCRPPPLHPYLTGN